MYPELGVNVLVQKKDPNAIIPFKTHTEDFCYDVVAISKKQIYPNIYEYGIGLSFEIESIDNEINSIDIRPRSSIWKTGMVLSNSIGTIDELYRGEVKVVFYHVFPEMPEYEVGDKIAQIKLGITKPLNFIESESLSETKRGDGGFGSTGK